MRPGMSMGVQKLLHESRFFKHHLKKLIGRHLLITRDGEVNFLLLVMFFEFEDRHAPHVTMVLLNLEGGFYDTGSVIARPHRGRGNPILVLMKKPPTLVTVSGVLF